MYTNLCGTDHSKKLFFPCKLVVKLISDEGGKKNICYARVSESQEGRLHASRVPYPRINIYMCTHASYALVYIYRHISFIDVEKRDSLSAREARDFTRLLWRVRVGHHFFKRDPLFAIWIYYIRSCAHTLPSAISYSRCIVQKIKSNYQSYKVSEVIK